MRGRLITSKSDERIFVGLIVVGFIAAAAAKQAAAAAILPLGDFSDEAQEELHGARARRARARLRRG